MKFSLLVFSFFFLVTNDNYTMYAQDSSSIVWLLNRTDSLGGVSAKALNDYPSLISTTIGDALQFDGIDDALLIEYNPLEDAESFTIEVIIKPDSSSNPENFEQRYVHIRGKANDDRRILLELRLTEDQNWYLDTFIKSEVNNKALINPELVHESGKWYNVALVYENGVMRHYVNGIEEASGEVTYIPPEKGQISIGARQDPRSWFKGAIHLIKFTRQALKPEEFISLVSNLEEE